MVNHFLFKAIDKQILQLYNLVILFNLILILSDMESSGMEIVINKLNTKNYTFFGSFGSYFAEAYFACKI